MAETGDDSTTTLKSTLITKPCSSGAPSSSEWNENDSGNPVISAAASTASAGANDPSQLSCPPTPEKSPPPQEQQQQQRRRRQQQHHGHVIESISTFEEMNPSRRCSHEDCSIYEPAGTWGCPDPNMALLAVCDGHGGRDMVDYLEHGLVFHVAEELKAPSSSSPPPKPEQTTSSEHRQDDSTTANSHPNHQQGRDLRGVMDTIDDIPLRLERAFLMADIHSKTLGVKTSGATVALCLVQRHRRDSHRGHELHRNNDSNTKPIQSAKEATPTTSTMTPGDSSLKPNASYSDEDNEQQVTMTNKTRAMNNKDEDGDDDHENELLPIWTIHAANAGDARIVLGHEGLATRLTHDHRTDDPDEVRRIEAGGGFVFKGRVLGVLAVTRSLGDHSMKDFVIANPFCKSVTISKQPKHVADEPSFIICACDGLFDVMSDQDAVDFVLEHMDEKESIAQLLVKRALRLGSTDNITATVAWL